MRSMKWRDDAIMRSQSTSLIERRAYGAGDGRSSRPNTPAARSPLEAKEKDEWRYWQARIYCWSAVDAEAKEILHALMQKRGFIRWLRRSV